MLGTVGPLMPRFVNFRRYRFSFESVQGALDNDNALGDMSMKENMPWVALVQAMSMAVYACI